MHRGVLSAPRADVLLNSYTHITMILLTTKHLRGNVQIQVSPTYLGVLIIKYAQTTSVDSQPRPRRMLPETGNLG